MVERAVKAGVPFSWVAGDAVYGGNPERRSWLEEQEISYVPITAAEARRMFCLSTRVTRPAQVHRQWSR